MESNTEQKIEPKSVYRPHWTCGRYDGKSLSAVIYNLLEGINYFFEDYSAIVIREVLALPRGGKISIDDLAARTEIPVEILMPFLDELAFIGLISYAPIRECDIDKYRIFVRQHKSTETHQYPYSASSADTALKLYAKRTGKPVVTAMLELTYRCSEQCVHCYNPGASRNDTEESRRHDFFELSLADYKRIIDELYEEGVVDICLSGGDPFSYQYIWDIIKYLYAKDIAFEIFTNGQNLHGKCGELSRYYPSAVGISLYSSDAKIHDAITRVKGSFLKSMETIQELYELSVPLEIKCCIMRKNFKTYSGVADIAKRYGGTLQLECNIFDSMDGDSCVSHYQRLTPEQMELTLRDPENPLYVGYENLDVCVQKKDLSAPACSAGNQFFCVTPDGNLVPCSSFHAKIGNLKESSLKELLGGNAELKQWQDLSLGQYEECGTHAYCDFCKLCPGLNFAEHGTVLKAAENNCYLAKIRYSLYEKLKSGIDPLAGRNLKTAIQTLPEYASGIPCRISGDNFYDKPIKINKR